MRFNGSQLTTLAFTVITVTLAAPSFAASDCRNVFPDRSREQMIKWFERGSLERVNVSEESPLDRYTARFASDPGRTTIAALYGDRAFLYVLSANGDLVSESFDFESRRLFVDLKDAGEKLTITLPDPSHVVVAGPDTMAVWDRRSKQWGNQYDFTGVKPEQIATSEDSLYIYDVAQQTFLRCPWTAVPPLPNDAAAHFQDLPTHPRLARGAVREPNLWVSPDNAWASFVDFGTKSWHRLDFKSRVINRVEIPALGFKPVTSDNARNFVSYELGYRGAQNTVITLHFVDRESGESHTRSVNVPETLVEPEVGSVPALVNGGHQLIFSTVSGAALIDVDLGRVLALRPMIDVTQFRPALNGVLQLSVAHGRINAALFSALNAPLYPPATVEK